MFVETTIVLFIQKDLALAHFNFRRFVVFIRSTRLLLNGYIIAMDRAGVLGVLDGE